LTIGHSTRTIADFIDLLRTHGVQLIVDIRTVPVLDTTTISENTLAASLKKSGIEYVRLKELGGLRHPMKDSQTWVGGTSPFEDLLTTCRPRP